MPEPPYSAHPSVKDDVNDIVSYIAQDNPTAAREVRVEIRSNFELIAQPNMNIGSAWETDIPELQGILYWPLRRYKGRILIFWMPHQGKPRILYVYRAAWPIDEMMEADVRE